MPPHVAKEPHAAKELHAVSHVSGWEKNPTKQPLLLFNK